MWVLVAAVSSGVDIEIDLDFDFDAENIVNHLGLANSAHCIQAGARLLGSK